MGAEHGLKPWELPQRIHLEATPFSDANGLLTSMGKPCRPALIGRYRRVLCPEGDGDGDGDGDGPHAALPDANVEGGGGGCDGLCDGLCEVLREVAGGGGGGGALRLRAEAPLHSLGLDSLAIARLSSRLADRFGVSLAPRTLFVLPTLAALEAALFGGEAVARQAVHHQ